MAPALDARWLEPLRARNAPALAAAFHPDASVRILPEGTARQGQRAIEGWLQHGPLAWPYAEVVPVYLGPSARGGTDLLIVDLVDARGAPLVRLTAKLQLRDQRYASGDLHLEERSVSTCSP